MASSIKKGFTLIEILVFMAIFSLIVVGLMVIFIAIITTGDNESAVTEVGQQGGFLLQQIQYYVGSARLVDMSLDTATSTLTLREFSSAQDPTSVTLSNNTVYLQQGSAGTEQALTSNNVSVSNLSFTRHYNLTASSSPFGADSVSFSFMVSATSTNGKSYSQSFQSSAAVTAPVGKIALIQHAATSTNGTDVSSISLAYASNNETGSLLIAVVAQTTSTASVSLSDSAGNTWTRVANPSYPVYNTRITVFAAVNAVNSSNTVSTTFGAPVGYPSLFLYEYRGASTSSSFNASSTQLQPDTQTPSSGLANPTSSVELIFGATYDGNTSEIPTPGTGFTLEDSSTISDVFTEDMLQYVTGPVAATWQYSVTTPSSSALVVTFR